MSSGLSGDAGFIVVRSGGRPVHPRSLGSLGCAQGFSGLIRSRLFHWGAPHDCRVHQGSLGSLGCAPGLF